MGAHEVFARLARATLLWVLRNQCQCWPVAGNFRRSNVTFRIALPGPDAWVCGHYRSPDRSRSHHHGPICRLTLFVPVLCVINPSLPTSKIGTSKADDC